MDNTLNPNVPFEALMIKMLTTYRAKNHDYDGSKAEFANCRSSEAMGIPAWKGVLIRMGDKFSRLVSFAKQGELKVKDESVEDTFIDMANYALIGHILYQDAKKAAQLEMSMRESNEKAKAVENEIRRESARICIDDLHTMLKPVTYGRS